MKKISLLIIFCFFFNLAFTQNLNYATFLIPENLKEDANSVVRFQQIDINIVSQKQLTIKKHKVVTVLNKYGINNIDAFEFYDKSSQVRSIEATIYDSFGKEIKKIKRKDFRDQSVADGVSIYTDNRKLFLDYTPITYPFTVVFESETVTSNTAFILSWFPIDDAFESIEKSKINITYPKDLGFKYLEKNIENKNIIKTVKESFLSFSVENLFAEKIEDYSPSFKKIIPHILFSVEKMNLEGVLGEVKTWENYGYWIYNNLIKDTEELSIETQEKIKELVKNETDQIKKAKIIYKYVQDKTRYVSVQLGIGGWKPMLAKDVDRLGYGDCKALTNYTRVLLKTVGVESYYTIVYGDDEKIDFQKDFVSMQGNHIILTLPTKDKNIFLECTSQTLPFGFNGNFSDDRYALVVKPDGGEIIKTNEYLDKFNSQMTIGNYSINEEGTIIGNLQIKSKGIQYDNKYSIELKSKLDIDEHYKSYFSWINNLKLENIKHINNKEDVEFIEDLKINAVNYGSINNNIIMFPINAFNQSSNIPKRYRNRKNSFEISRGYLDEDDIEISIPEGYIIDAKPNDFDLNDKFGNYKTEIILINSNKIKYKRTLIINKGFYDKSEYDNYRKFREQIAKNDNSKLVIIKK